MPQRRVQITNWRIIFALTSLIALSTGMAFGQGTITGTILGTVKDASGSAIPGARIVVTREDTGITREGITDQNGNFMVTFLPIGKYNVKAQANGFRTEVRSGIGLEIDQKLPINFTLQVGQLTQEVVVQADAGLVNSQTSDIGELIENRRVTELPLNGRQFSQLILLTAGATPEPQGLFSGPFAVAGQSPNVNGNRSDANQYLIDGISINDITYNHLSASPSVDAIQEFKVQSGMYSAEFGSTNGAQINVTLKSGTNRPHGSLWEFVRNDKLDSKNYFDRRSIPPFRQNQFGGTLGGPIIHGKTFFFVNYEGLRVRKGISITSAVPTLAMRKGDFRGLAPIFNPATFNPATKTSTPFANNQIPDERISPVAKAVLALIPEPNISSGLGRNYAGFGKRITDSNQVNTRIDHNFNASNTIFGRLTFSDISDLNPVPGTASFETASAPVSPPGFGQNTSVRGVNTALQWTHLFSQAVINQLRIGYNYTGTRQTQENKSDFSGANGIQGNDNRTFSNGVPGFNILGFSSFGGTTFDLNWRNNSFTLIDDLSYVRGRHTIKVGFSGERLLPSTRFLLSPRGSFTFRNIFTADPQNPTGTGNSFADFLLGLPNTAAAGVGDNLVHLQSWRFGTYVQDDWKVSTRLTVNLGIRFEFTPHWIEKNNKWANIDLTAGGRFVIASDHGEINPAAKLAAFPSLTFVTSDKAGFPRALVDNDYKAIAPRIGFAYAFDDQARTVLRGGYGIFYTRDVVASNGLSFNPPFFGNKSFTNSNLAALIPVQTALISTGTVLPNAQGIARNAPNGYMQQWSLGLQRQLASDLVVEANYLGTKGTKLAASISPNQAVPGTTPLVQRIPYPNLAAGVSLMGAYSWSSYNAVTLSMRKSFSRGLSFSSNYTWAKSLDTISSGNSNTANSNKPQDSRNIAAEWGPSIFDVGHRFVANYIYDLPFGKGRKFAIENRAWDFFFGGWSTTGILTLQGRLPFSPLLGIDRSGTGVFQDRPNQVGDPNAIDKRTPDKYFNTAAFALQPAGQFGNAGRDTIRGPNFYQFDSSIIKNFKVRESQQFEFRAEFFNLLNHPNFKLPNRIFGTADFGQIFSAYDAREIQFGLKYSF
ncbi:MAG TPA: TonB-dependent receptor [Candidatus Dormibacteraeota bacterium]|nr:TonB-dependent receptor [Candidatus Dormibacteraeota bacterium]